MNRQALVIPVAGGTAMRLAEHAYDRAQASPRTALRDADRAARLAGAEGDLAALAAARRAEGYAYTCLGALHRAVPTLRDAIRLADRAGDRRMRGLARMSHASAQMHSGRLRIARKEFERARADLTGLDGARCENLRLVIACSSGDARPVIDTVHPALAVLDAAGDTLWASRLRFNRAVALIESGRLDEGDHDRVVADLRQRGEAHRRIVIRPGRFAFAHYRDCSRTSEHAGGAGRESRLYGAGGFAIRGGNR